MRSRAMRITPYLLSLLVLTAAAVPVAAQEERGGAPGEWLSRYTSARSLGLGGSFVATADDPLGVVWNPAGISMMDQNQLSFETARLYEQTSMYGFGFAVPGSWLPSFGLSVISLGSGDFQKTNELNDDLGTFKNSETAYMFTVARAFSPTLSVGTNVKIVQQAVEDFSGGGVGFDAGVLWSPVPGLSLGGSILNVGGPSVKLRDVGETYPTEYRGGFAWQLLDGRGLITMQIDQSDGAGTVFHGGSEYWIQPGMALRVGFDQDGGTGGFSYRFHPAYQLDYGVSDHVLGMAHRVGLSYRFGGFFAKSEAHPQVFSPTGERAVTRIELNARTKADAREWTLELRDKGKLVVRRFGGPGQPPAHLLWDGKDESGLPLPDGVYHYVLTVVDDAGRVLVSPERTIEIATDGPQGSVPVIPLSEEEPENEGDSPW